MRGCLQPSIDLRSGEVSLSGLIGERIVPSEDNGIPQELVRELLDAAGELVLSEVQ